MKPTLLLLAAGMGSRYGGLKQLDGLGPNGETIMDYSIGTKTGTCQSRHQRYRHCKSKIISRELQYG